MENIQYVDQLGLLMLSTVKVSLTDPLVLPHRLKPHEQGSFTHMAVIQYVSEQGDDKWNMYNLL